jgi:hypothetical protein
VVIRFLFVRVCVFNSTRLAVHCQKRDREKDWDRRKTDILSLPIILQNDNQNNFLSDRYLSSYDGIKSF